MRGLLLTSKSSSFSVKSTTFSIFFNMVAASSSEGVAPCSHCIQSQLAGWANKQNGGRMLTSYSFTDLLISEQIEFVFRPNFTTSPSFMSFPFSAILRDLPSLRSMASICPLTFWIDILTVVYRCGVENYSPNGSRLLRWNKCMIVI